MNGVMLAPPPEPLMTPPGWGSQGSRRVWARTVFIIGLLLICWAERLALDVLRDSEGPLFLTAAGSFGSAIIPWFLGVGGYILSGRRTALMISGVVLLVLVMADRL